MLRKGQLLKIKGAPGTWRLVQVLNDGILLVEGRHKGKGPTVPMEVSVDKVRAV